MILDIKRVTSREVTLLLPYHYLIEESKGFRSGYNYGVYANNTLQAVCIFHNPSVPELMKGCFGLKRNEQEGIFELGRLVRHPNLEKGFILSQFVAGAIKSLRKDTKVKALISYADSRFHTGFIYQALNFRYYGLTKQRSDYWFEQPDGSFIKHTRGKVKGTKGEWRPRPRKHRYLMVYDNTLHVQWKEEPYPKADNINYIGDIGNGSRHIQEST